jgi:hypothetical protein
MNELFYGGIKISCWSLSYKWLCTHSQGTLSEGEGSVRLTSSQRQPVFLKLIIFALPKSGDLNQLSQGGQVYWALPFSKGFPGIAEVCLCFIGTCWDVNGVAWKRRHTYIDYWYPTPPGIKQGNSLTLIQKLNQGSLTEGEGSVPLTSLY